MLPINSLKIYSVTEITAEVKTLLEGNFSNVSIEGEISNFIAASSGHIYFVLKDKGAQIKCAFFRGKARYLRFKPADGQQVVATGSLGVYEPRGEYQLYVGYLEPKGVGQLQQAFERLKAKLEAEGLFSPEHKKPLPLLPRKIGIVTSPTGAVIQDILRILGRRHHNLQILLYPAKVQGEGAAQEVAAGIRYLGTLPDIDVLIVGRGGGSIEDLWAFNEEIVARTIYDSKIPVISAVGHETDFTIADFVADLRAPTPSAAAELVVLKKSEFVEQVNRLENQLAQFLHFRLSRFRNRVLALGIDKVSATVAGRLRLFQQRLDELDTRVERGFQQHFTSKRNQGLLLGQRLQRFEPAQLILSKRQRLEHRLDQLLACWQLEWKSAKGACTALDGRLEALNPMAVLDRGYAICRDGAGNILKDARKVGVGDPFSVTLAQGSLDGKVEKILPESGSRPRPES